VTQLELESTKWRIKSMLQKWLGIIVFVDKTRIGIFGLMEDLWLLAFQRQWYF
jgi:hypothetical protein